MTAAPSVEVVVVFVSVLFAIAWGLEYWRWNGGRCKFHGKPWTWFTNDSQGGRGYWCGESWADGSRCNVWISWPLVERIGGKTR